MPEANTVQIEEFLDAKLKEISEHYRTERTNSSVTVWTMDKRIGDWIVCRIQSDRRIEFPNPCVLDQAELRLFLRASELG